METLDETLKEVHQWVIHRASELEYADDLDNAKAIWSEFSEWMNAADEEHDIFSLEYIGDGSKFDK